MGQKKNIDATTGSISKNLWILAWPIIIGNIVQVIYNMADTFWVGRLENSTNALGAVAVTFSVVFVLVSLAAGLTVGSTTLVSQYFGAEEYDKIEKVVYTSFIVIGGLAILFTVIGIAFSSQLFQLLQTDKAIIPIAKSYFNIIMVGMIFMFIFFIMSSLLRGVGDTKTPMIAGVVSGVLNMILDPILIFGIGPIPALGVDGAAYATVFSRVIAAVYIFYIVLRGRTFLKIKLSHFTVDWHIAKKIFQIGIPSSVSQVVVSLGGTLILGRINTFGPIATAVHGIGSRLDSLLLMPVTGLAQAANAMVGQNLGAGKRDRAFATGKYAIRSSMLILAGLGILFAIFPSAFFKAFSQDAAVIELGKYYVWGETLFFAFVGGRIVMSNVFQGAGAATLSMVLSLMSLWVFRVPMSYAFSFTALGVKGAWLGIGLSFVISFFFMYYFYKKGDWMNKRVM